MTDLMCSVDGCGRAREHRDWCNMHYQRWLKYGDPGEAKPRRRSGGPCIVDGCNKPALARGWCRRHYQSWRKHGDPTVIRAEPESEASRFWKKVIQGGACLIWTGSVDPGGYGTFGVRGRTISPHRWVWTFTHGPVPDGLHLDHLCRVRRCVNTAHLEPVTPLENTRRGLKGLLRTHCKRGHPYDASNKYGDGVRSCSICKRELARLRASREPDREAGSATP